MLLPHWRRDGQLQSLCKGKALRCKLYPSIMDYITGWSRLVLRKERSHHSYSSTFSSNWPAPAVLRNIISSKGGIRMTIPFVVLYEAWRKWGHTNPHPWAQQVMSNNCCVGIQSGSDMSSRRPLILVLDSLSAMLHMGPSSAKSSQPWTLPTTFFGKSPRLLEFYLPLFLSPDTWTYYCWAQILFYLFIFVFILFCFYFLILFCFVLFLFYLFMLLWLQLSYSLNPNTLRTILNMQLVA